MSDLSAAELPRSCTECATLTKVLTLRMNYTMFGAARVRLVSKLLSSRICRVSLLTIVLFNTQIEFAAGRSCANVFSVKAKPVVVKRATKDVIASVVNGGQVYQLVTGEKGQTTADGEGLGVYRRTAKSWKLVVPGEIRADSNGRPTLVQLSLSRSDDKGYIMTVVDGEIYLLTNQSNLEKPGTFIRFGNSTNPLFEVGSTQKRFLSPLPPQAKISIFQYQDLSSTGGQTVLVSIKFDRPESTGQGMTFAFELLPNGLGGLVRLNGNPVVIDYDFHSPIELGHLIAAIDDRETSVYSKILIEQFAAQDLSHFGGQVAFVKKKLTDFVNAALKAVKPGLYISDEDNTVGYNLTTGKPVRNVSFENEVYNDGVFELTQHYYDPSGPYVEVKGGDNDAEFTTWGMLDILPNKKPAVWQNSEQSGTVLYMVDGTLHLSFVDENGTGDAVLAELGDLKTVFPFITLNDDVPLAIDYHVIPPAGNSHLEKPIVLMSVKTKTGKAFTSAIRLNYFLQNLLRIETSFKLTNFKMSSEELVARTDVVAIVKENTDEGKDDDGSEDSPKSRILFDDLTPAAKSLSAYEQRYDASRPHADLMTSVTGRTAYIFKRPSSTIVFEPGLTYAHFSLTKGVSDPSGLYVDVLADGITGNETTRFVGEIVPHPLIKKELPENEEYRRYIFAEIAAPKLGVQSGSASQSDTDDGPSIGSTSAHNMYLMAVDANRSKGKSGYKFVLSVPDKEGKYSLLPVELPRGVTADISSFKDANFIRGRKYNNSSVFLILAFKGSGPKGEAFTYSVHVSLTEDGFSTDVVKVDDRAIAVADLNRSLGFTEDGIPALVMTPDLAQEAHQFAIFDLLKGGKVYPNQNYTNSDTQYKGMKFGDFKGGVANFQNFLRPEDSWATTSFEIRTDYPTLGRSRELAQFDSFIELGRQLDEMASAKNPATRLLLVVPEALRDLVWDFVLSRATSEKLENSENRFNTSNRNLNLQLIDEKRASQVQYFANLDLWTKMARTEPNERNFLIARVDELVSWKGESEDGEAAEISFKIREISAGSSTDLSPMTTSRLDRAPHPLYLLAAGKPMSLKEFRAEKPKPDASMIVLATPEELKALEDRAGAEIEHGMLDAFKIQEIKDPDHESMALSITSIFSHPDVKSLGFKFSAERIKDEKFNSNESFDVVIDYAISRFAYFVTEKKEPIFESFMRFRAAFANSVLTDKEARRSRVLDKHFVERVLTKVFDIPMNLQTLPADDPMRILSEQRALLKWQEAGYAGPFDLKASMRDTIVSQTRADAGKPIPSSIILFGNTGAGKTYAFKTLVKMLGLKMYDFNATENPDAQAIILNVGQLLERSGQNRDGNMDADQAIAHLEKFLSGPNGYRGWILIDDVHAAKDSVKAKVVSWLRSIFESQDGMYSFSQTGTRRPIRNLNIFLTLNPTADQDQIGKYSKRRNEPTSEEVLLATLSTEEFKVEPSFLRRWGRIVNLDFMPAGAKGPELINSMARASNSLLNMHNMIALVDPKVIKMLVTGNSEVDARTFLSASTSALIEAASPNISTPTETQQSAVVMVVPALSKRMGRIQASTDSPGETIARSVREGTRTLALDSGLEGRLTFLRMIVDAFRVPIYESFVLSLQEDPRFSGDAMAQRMFLAPILTAMIDHLQKHPNVTAADLGVTASDFGMRTPNERELFRSTVERITANEDTKDLPQLPLRDRLGSTWQDIVGDSSVPSARSRADVLGNTLLQNRKAIADRLVSVLRVQDLDSMPDPATWLTGLSPKSGLDPKLVGRALAENLWTYLPAMFAEEVNRNHSDPISTYSATRLFLISVDRSMLQMPWMNSSKFLLRSLELITRDQVLSQKPGVQNFLFADPQRLVKPTITDFVFQIIASSHAAEEVPAETKKRDRATFEGQSASGLLDESARR